MTTITKHTETWATLDHDEGTFRLAFMPDSEDVEVRVAGNRAVVGYLVHDEDCLNPIENYDCQGTLYTTGNDTITDDARACYASVGLDSEGNPDIELFGEQTESPEEDHALELWKEARKVGTLGEPYAVIIDYRDWGSGGSAYRVEECANTFDYTKHIDGVWYPDKDLLEDIRMRETEEDRWRRAIEICASILEEYTKWCNGDCWGYITQMFVRADESSAWTQQPQSSTMYYRENGELKEHTYTEQWEGCWGMIGYEYAHGSMVEEVESVVKNWNKDETTR